MCYESVCILTKYEEKKKPSLVIHGCALHEMCFVDRDQMKWILTEDMQKDILIFTKGVPE